MQRGYRGLAVLTLCLWSHPGWTQIPVTDVGNLAVNTTSAVQAVITATHSVLTVANQVLDLTPLDEWLMGGAEWAEDMALLKDTLETAKLLFADIGSLNRQMHTLFHLDNTPSSTTELQKMLREAGQLAREVYIYAMRTQTLMMTLMRTLDHFTKLMGQLSTIVGNKQGQQVAIQANADIAKTLKILEIQTAAFHRAQSVQQITEPITIEALYRIQEHIMMDWPRR